MSHTEFDTRYVERLAAVESNWWARGMREIGAAMLGRVEPGLAVLDGGCGAGANLAWLTDLARTRRVIAVDVAAPAVERCKRLLLSVDPLQASLRSLPFADGRFDLVVTTDVLQHLTAAAASAGLAEIRRVLRPGGRLLVRTNAAFGRARVPQRPDWRLYTPGALQAELERAGLVVERVTPVNALLGAWASLPRPHRSRPQAAQDHCVETVPMHGLGIPEPGSGAKNWLLLWLLRAEARWLAAPDRRLPFGHSLYALARRPGPDA